MANVTAAVKNESLAANPAQEEIKELKHKLFEQETILEKVLLNLEKANTVLDHWEDKYSFYKEPSPGAAIAWARTISNKDTHGKQSFRWYQEYNLISQLISIASDYVHESKRLLEKTVSAGATPAARV